MPELKIKIPPEVHQTLKNYAKEDERSLSKYIERGLKYLSDHPYHKLNIQPISVPEYTYTTTTTAGLAQTPALNIEQLQEQGVSQIKFNKPQTQRQLTPEEEELHQARLQRQLASIKQQRIKFLKQKAGEILGYSLPYLEENNQKTIDWVLNQYPTDEDIITYLQNLKTEDENYIEEDDNIDNTTEPQSEYYQKIKRYYTQHLEPYEFEDLMSNVRAGHIDYLKDYHQLNMFDALNIPHSHSWTDDEWNEMIKELNN
jgi:hypothetical protein